MIVWFVVVDYGFGYFVAFDYWFVCCCLVCLPF